MCFFCSAVVYGQTGFTDFLNNTRENERDREGAKSWLCVPSTSSFLSFKLPSAIKKNLLSSVTNHCCVFPEYKQMLEHFVY